MTVSTTPILVTGGTGTLGGHVVSLLRDAGCTLRILSRHEHSPGPGTEHVVADLAEPADGRAVARAATGVDTIIHLAGASKGDDVLARQLVDAIRAVGSGPHIVNISVVGADRTPVVSALDRAMFGYFASKRAAEEVIAGSGLPWTTLRATQFHDLALTAVRALARLPVVPLPTGTRAQPVETHEVAQRLVELALGTPQGLVDDLAGPRIYGMGELLRSYLRASGKRRARVPVRLPGRAAAAFRDGCNLNPARAVGHRTWEDFLAATVTRGR